MRSELCALHRTPYWLMEAFDRTIRPLLYDAERIVRPFVAAGDRVADIGCGTGYFSAALARLIGPSGELLLVDVQEEMVRRAVERVRREQVATASVVGVIVSEDQLQLPPDVDFALMSWMLHEVARVEQYWRALGHSIRPAGKVLVIEPLLHVSTRRWEEELAPAEAFGFVRSDLRGTFFSRTAVLTKR
ncbi:MAG: class I SAM-dependent methyltransferase [Armatimonadota bacterium]|jgi:ubiquinone/menaquinone biosynthesis C-methylase UbiE